MGKERILEPVAQLRSAIRSGKRKKRERQANQFPRKKEEFLPRLEKSKTTKEE